MSEFQNVDLGDCDCSNSTDVLKGSIYQSNEFIDVRKGIYSYHGLFDEFLGNTFQVKGGSSSDIANPDYGLMIVSGDLYDVADENVFRRCLLVLHSANHGSK